MNDRRSIEPADIAVDRQEGRMTVTWKEGHISAYPFDLLRSSCPCAACNDLRARQSEAGDLRVLPSSVTEDSVRVQEVKMVGRYALQFLWKDGHSTGIYSFEFLRSLCPCDECRRGRGQLR